MTRHARARLAARRRRECNGGTSRLILAVIVVCLAYWLTACGGSEDNTYTVAEASDYAHAYCADKRGFVDADFRLDVSPPRAFFVCGDGSTTSVLLGE